MSVKRQLSPEVIQQQLYTRERSGIFRTTEGFDTVAVSDGLDPVFIKKQLHPFCGYDAPAELVARGEKEENCYPPAIHLYHTASGETVLGRSIFQSADFTGLRSAFLTHNYVIPHARLDEIVDGYERYLGAAFADKYVIEIGRVLPELDELPDRPRFWTEGPMRLSPDELLQELKLDERLFKHLLFAVMTSVGEGRKKVYVSLDVPAEQISQYAVSLLRVLYALMPYEHRRRLGFITYVKEPQSRKHIHLQFVERGGIRANDREIEKDFVFDLASGRWPQEELDHSKQPYLDMAWRAISSPAKLRDFHRFAEEMLDEMEPQRQVQLVSYHELSMFYQIEQGAWELYDAHKVSVLSGLLTYLELEGGVDKRIRLNDIFLAAFDREYDAVRMKQEPNYAAVTCFRAYYRLDPRGYGAKFINYMIHAINNAYTSENNELVQLLYDLIEDHPELSRAFFELVLQHQELSKRLFEPYITHKIKALSGIKELFDRVHAWIVAHPLLLEQSFFHEVVTTSLRERLRKEKEKRQLLAAVQATLDAIRKWGRTQTTDFGISLVDSELAQQLSSTAKELLLDELDLDMLTREQVVAAEFLGQPDAFAELLLEGQRIQHVDMLQALYEWNVQRDPTETILRGMSQTMIRRLQQIERNWLEPYLQQRQFGKVVLAFYREVDGGTVEYDELMDYLHKHASDRDIIYEFILWSQGHRLFVKGKGFVPSYVSSIITYFKKHDREAFKSRDYRIRYFDKAGAELASVLFKARLELSSPLKRFVLQNSRQVKMSLLVLLSTLVIVCGILLVMQQQGLLGGRGEKSAGMVNPSNSYSTADVLIYAENVGETVDNGRDASSNAGDLNGSLESSEPDSVADVTRLVFLFKTLETCQSLDPSNLSIEMPDQSVQQLMNLKTIMPCAVSLTSDDLYRLEVSLGQQLDLPSGTRIRIGEQSYSLVTREVAEAAIMGTSSADHEITGQ